MDNNDLAILIVSFDGYSDIWDAFELCINKHWKDRKVNTYLISNNLEPNYDNISVIKTGNEVSWSNRLRVALKDLKEKYVLLLLEDYLIDSKVNNILYEKAVNYLINNDIDYLRIAPIPKLKKSNKATFATEITKNMVYGVNLQAALWKKSYLMRTLYDDDFSAWEFEARQKFSSSHRINGKCYATNAYIISYLNGIIQGKWYLKTLCALEKQGVVIEKYNRSVMTDSDMKREKFRNFLLHHIPPQIIQIVKPIAKKMGFYFVTE